MQLHSVFTCAFKKKIWTLDAALRLQNQSKPNLCAFSELHIKAWPRHNLKLQASHQMEACPLSDYFGFQKFILDSLKAPLRNLFTLKKQLQNNVDGTLTFHGEWRTTLYGSHSYHS